MSNATFRRIIASDAAAGLALIAAAALALVVANLPATAGGYAALLHHRTGPVLARPLGPMTVHLWINDGLMALFFLLVGLEIKREMILGSLADAARRRLPVIAAIAGMAAPALVFLLVTRADPALQPGWAVPAATDIAFAIGVLALLGRRVPPALKLLLTTVAIVDDMGAVAIIALAYTDAIDLTALVGAGVVLAGMVLLNRRGVTALAPYLAGFALLWLLVLLSGVHATIAGVLAAATIPLRGAGSPLARLEHALQPWVAFAIVPLFGFANAGVALGGTTLATLTQTLVLGIALGLFLGKQIGIFGAIRLADRFGLARRPAGVSWLQLYGMALLAGIGFTMSLFIGDLAFADPATVDAVKIGVLAGSIAAALAGVAVLLVGSRTDGRD